MSEPVARRHREKLVRAGLLPKGVHGSAPRHTERDAVIVSLRAQGVTWCRIGQHVGLSSNAARKAWERVQERTS